MPAEPAGQTRKFVVSNMDGWQCRVGFWFWSWGLPERNRFQGKRSPDPELLAGLVSPSGGKNQRDPFTALQISGMRHILWETRVPQSQRQSGKTINKSQPLETLPKPQALLRNLSLYRSLSSKNRCMQRLSSIPHNYIIILCLLSKSFVVTVSPLTVSDGLNDVCN